MLLFKKVYLLVYSYLILIIIYNINCTHTHTVKVDQRGLGLKMLYSFLSLFYIHSRMFNIIIMTLVHEMFRFTDVTIFKIYEANGKPLKYF